MDSAILRKLYFWHVICDYILIMMLSGLRSDYDVMMLSCLCSDYDVMMLSCLHSNYDIMMLSCLYLCFDYDVTTINMPM